MLVVLSLWVGGMSFLCTPIYQVKESLFGALLFCLRAVSVIFFSVANWFSLYFLFERSLIPILMLILGWGYQPERLQAGLYIIIYTVCSSIPLLMTLTYLYGERQTMSFFAKYQGTEVMLDGTLLVDHYVILFLLGAFLVKSPVFLVHMWLPKAHVEAPVAGSIILAGVLLKFGGYGCVLVFYYFISFQSAVLDFLMTWVM